MDWQDATISTIQRLKDVNALADLSPEHRCALYARASEIAGKVADEKKFWNVFLNVLRIFTAAEADRLPTKRELYTTTKPTRAAASYVVEDDQAEWEERKRQNEIDAAEWAAKRDAECGHPIKVPKAKFSSPCTRPKGHPGKHSYHDDDE